MIWLSASLMALLQFHLTTGTRLAEAGPFVKSDLHGSGALRRSNLPSMEAIVAQLAQQNAAVLASLQELAQEIAAGQHGGR